MALLWGGMWSSCTLPSGPDWEREARLRVVCCPVISNSALAVWVGCSAGALSGGQKESHVLLLVAEKGTEIFLFIFILSLVCISSFFASWGTAFYFWFYFQPHWEAGGILELHGQNPEGSGILPGQQSGQPRAEPRGKSWVWNLALVGEGQTQPCCLPSCCERLPGLLPGGEGVWTQLKKRLLWLLLKPVLSSVSASGVLLSVHCASKSSESVSCVWVGVD